MAEKAQPKSDPHPEFQDAQGHSPRGGSVEMAEREKMPAASSGGNGGAGAAGAPKGGDLSHDNKDLTGLTQAAAEERLREDGLNEIPEEITPYWLMLLKQFYGPMPMAIALAGIISIATVQYDDFAIIFGLLFINAALGFHEEAKASAAMRALADSLTPKIAVARDGEYSQRDVTELVVGDVIFLRGGTKVPADCHFVEGDELTLDNSSLTGESRPEKRPDKGFTITKVETLEDGHVAYDVDKAGNHKMALWRDQLRWAEGTDPPNRPPQEGDVMDVVECLCGGTCKQGEAYCIVDRTGLDTEIGSAAGSKKGPGKGKFQRDVEIACMVIILGTLLFVLFEYLVMVYLYNKPQNNYIQISGTLLPVIALIIASVPVALPMVITVTLAMGAKKMSEHAAIVTNLDALQQIASMDVLCSDKTGTLTTANMTVYRDRIWANEESGFTARQVALFAGLASNRSNVDDPIDAAVFRAFDEEFGGGAEDPEQAKKNAIKVEDEYEETKFVGFNPIVKRTVTYTRNKETGKEYMIGKGLLDKILDTEKDGGVEWKCIDFDKVSPIAHKADEDLGMDAFKTIAVCCQELPDGPVKFVGILPMRDPPRHDTAETIANVRAAGVGVKMITGDHVNIARKTAEQIKLGTHILGHNELWPASHERDELIMSSDGFAKVTPKDKLEVVYVIQNKYKIQVGMTGDGVNDAPALKQANIGIAVAGATDAARASADIVLTLGGLSPIYDAILESRRIFKRLRTYILYRLASTVQIVTVLWILNVAFNFNIPAFYIVLFALLCDLAALPIASDVATPTRLPSKIKLSSILYISGIMGLFLGAQTIIAYIFAVEVLYNPKVSFNGLASWNIGPIAPTLVVPSQFSTDAAGYNGGPFSPNWCNGSVPVGQYGGCGDLNMQGQPVSEVKSCMAIVYAADGPNYGEFVDQATFIAQGNQFTPTQQAWIYNPANQVVNPRAYCQIGSGLWLVLQLSVQIFLYQCRSAGFFLLASPPSLALNIGGFLNIAFVALLTSLGDAQGQNGNGGTYAFTPPAIVGWIFLYCILFALVLDGLKIVVFNWLDPQGEEMEEDGHDTMHGGWAACFKMCGVGRGGDSEHGPASQPSTTAFFGSNYAAEEEPQTEAERHRQDTMRIARSRTQQLGKERKKDEKGDRSRAPSSVGSQRSIRRQNTQKIQKQLKVKRSITGHFSQM